MSDKQIPEAGTAGAMIRDFVLADGAKFLKQFTWEYNSGVFNKELCVCDNNRGQRQEQLEDVFGLTQFNLLLNPGIHLYSGYGRLNISATDIDGILFVIKEYGLSVNFDALQRVANDALKESSEAGMIMAAVAGRQK